MDKRKVKEAKDAKLKASGTDKKKDRVSALVGREGCGVPCDDGPTVRQLLPLVFISHRSSHRPPWTRTRSPLVRLSA